MRWTKGGELPIHVLNDDDSQEPKGDANNQVIFCFNTWLTMEVDTTLGEPRSQSRSHTRLSLQDDSSFTDVKMYNDIQ